MLPFDLNAVCDTPFLFFTGKGGVGKTSVACAVAIALADKGKRILIVSTDPASNLQDVFGMALDNHPKAVPDVPGLFAANFDPVLAAQEYRERVIAPFRGIMPDEVIANMEEQLSGSCTVEIAAFDAFSSFITDEGAQREYDHILFDTAPTGHTLRMLQLPSAWSTFISESTHGASCLGQLSGLESRKAVYQAAVEALADGGTTTLVLVARPEEAPLKEAQRASAELAALGIARRILILNGMVPPGDDGVSQKLYGKQQVSLAAMPAGLKGLPVFKVPLKARNMAGIPALRTLFDGDDGASVSGKDSVLPDIGSFYRLDDIAASIAENDRKIVFTMGKGGVGKTSVAAAIALSLARRGKQVHLTTTDPAAHLAWVLEQGGNITMSHIDEQEQWRKYRQEVLAEAKANGLSGDDLAYIEEDLRSPCTQEIAVFRAFADIVEKAKDRILVIDTAPTGHTLLLLASVESYDREIRRTKGNTPESVKSLLPRIRSAETEVLVVTLPEATPVFEALRLEADLRRAGIAVNWWVINQSFYLAQPENALLKAKAAAETEWIDRVGRHTDGHFALLAWHTGELKGEGLLKL